MKPKYLESTSGINSIMYGYSLFSKQVYVYLHGAGEFGTDIERHYKYPGFATLLRDDELTIKHPFILACCQNGSHWRADQIETYLSDLSKKLENSEIHLIGYSRGGTGVYAYVSSYIRAKTATVINARPPSMPSSNFNTPVHIIHAEDDQVAPIEPLREYCDNNASKNIHLSVVQGDHYAIEDVAKSGLWLN